MTLFVDVSAKASKGVFLAASAGVGHRFAMEVDLLQFKTHVNAFAGFISSGDPEDLIEALGNTKVTFSVTGRRTGRAIAKFGGSYAGWGFELNASASWTDVDETHEVELTPRKGLKLITDPERIGDLVEKFSEVLTNGS